MAFGRRQLRERSIARSRSAAEAAAAIFGTGQ
jgi:hypothetical protein